MRKLRQRVNSLSKLTTTNSRARIPTQAFWFHPEFMLLTIKHCCVFLSSLTSVHHSSVSTFLPLACCRHLAPADPLAPTSSTPSITYRSASACIPFPLTFFSCYQSRSNCPDLSNTNSLPHMLHIFLLIKK